MFNPLSVQSRKLYAVLRQYHAHHRVDRAIDQLQINSRLITYGELCQLAGLPGLTRGVGKFLGEIAEYCADKGWPPINALAVNAESRMPGDSYDLAAGCSLRQWPQQVKAVLRFPDYPEVK